MDDLVLSQVADGIATLTLNRPDKANALSAAMMDALEAAVLAAATDPQVRVLVLTGAGKVFSAGHDLKEMLEHEDTAWHEAHFLRCSRLMAAIRACPKPVIARVQGAAVAAGCQLVATCDLAYAVETAKFGVNGINLGLFCSTPSVALSRAVPAKQALELALTGKLILAPRAVEIGLINAAVPADRLDETVAEAARAIAAKLPAAIAMGKALFHRQMGVSLEAAYADASQVMACNMGDPETRQLVAGFVARG
ncbi:enoyl-CoA hydratase [Oryzibacter oryziterrae]|uniref:enoyl-CoA hydratase n=1 Tax=Oryzibacter oryziterrae TaxID=2766474 RepID=UPI001F00ED96|nr:enoyl-CoA hydratase [Oryzibacter oryziterrae]